MNLTVSKMFNIIIYAQKAHSISKGSTNTGVWSCFEKILCHKFFKHFPHAAFFFPWNAEWLLPYYIKKKKKYFSQSGWMMVSQTRNISEFCPKTGQEIKKIKGGGRYVFLMFSGVREMFLWCLKCIQGFLQAVRAEALFHFHWKAGQKFSCFHFRLKSTVREAGLFPPCRTKKKS